MQVNASTNTRSEPSGDNARIRVRRDHFDLVMHMLGHTTNQSKAGFIDMHVDAIARARSGRPVSDRFIASTLTALERRRGFFVTKNTKITFEALFEPVAERVTAERAA